MKLIMVNWSWYATGGDWTYIENVIKLYENNGFDVIPFSQQHKENIPTAYDNYFVESYDFKELNKSRSIKNGIKVLRTSIVSKDAIQKLEKLLIDNPDIKFAHLQNIHHYITPAIIDVLKKKEIKILWTLHDFKIICPANSFLSNGKVCEKCITGNFYHCAINKCKRNSFLASVVAGYEAYYYHGKNIYNHVDYFLCPSQFLLNKFAQFGFSREKLVLAHSCYDVRLIDSFVEQNKYIQNSNDKFILYIGRLEELKGVHTLIDSVKMLNIPVKIVGSGNAEAKLKLQAKNNPNIEFLGLKSKLEVFALTQRSSFVICPSICYENLPFSVIESSLFSKPTIGSDIAGIPELVLNKRTGLLFEANNAADLCEKISYLWNHEKIAQQLGMEARTHVYNLVNFYAHWGILNKTINKLQIGN
jgi:glycosyltransferase involved in cell wall biosynthesis